MKETKMRKEAYNVLRNNMTDSLIFYMQEYRNDLSYRKIAWIFIREFISLATKLAKTFEEDSEEEA